MLAGKGWGEVPHVRAGARLIGRGHMEPLTPYANRLGGLVKASNTSTTTNNHLKGIGSPTLTLSAFRGAAAKRGASEQETPAPQDITRQGFRQPRCQRCYHWSDHRAGRPVVRQGPLCWLACVPAQPLAQRRTVGRSARQP